MDSGLGADPYWLFACYFSLCELWSVDSDGLVLMVSFILSVSCALFAFCSTEFPMIWGKGFDGDFPFRTVCCKDSLPMYNDLLCLCISPICCRRQLLWLWFNNWSMSIAKDNQESFYLYFYFLWTIVLCFTLNLWAFKSLVLGQQSSVRCGGYLME